MKFKDLLKTLDWKRSDRKYWKSIFIKTYARWDSKAEKIIPREVTDSYLDMILGKNRETFLDSKEDTWPCVAENYIKKEDGSFYIHRSYTDSPVTIIKRLRYEYRTGHRQIITKEIKDETALLL